MAPTHRPKPTISPQRRELYFFTLYRVLEASLLALVAFSPLGELLLQVREPTILEATVVLYAIGSIGLLLAAYRSRTDTRVQAAMGLGLDLAVAAVTLATTAGSAAADRDLTLEELPEPVRQTAIREVKHGTILEIEEDHDKGELVYEVEFVLDAVKYELDIAPDGTLLHRHRD